MGLLHSCLRTVNTCVARSDQHAFSFVHLTVYLNAAGVATDSGAQLYSSTEMRRVPFSKSTNKIKANWI